MRWDDQDPIDESPERSLSLRQLWHRIAPRMRPQAGSLAVGIALMLLSVGAELATPLILRRIIDQEIPLAGRTGSLLGIFSSAGLYLAIFLVGSAASYLQIVVIARMGLRIVARLKQDAFEHLLSLGMDYFDQNPPGKLLARVESDAEKLQQLFSDFAVSLLKNLLLLGGILGVMFWTDVRITLAVLLLAIPFFFSALLFVRYMRRLYARLRKIYARLSTFVTEYVQAVPVLQVYGRLPWAMGKLDRRNRERYRAEITTSFRDYGFWSFFSTLEVLAVMLILYVGFGGRFGVAMTLGTLVLFVEYTRRLFWPLVLFAEQLNMIQKAVASADRVFAILETPSSVRDRTDAHATVPLQWREIAFEKVVFAYPPRPGAAASNGGAAHALDGVSFRIRRGEKVALVGPSGSGKSTITSLLMRFYEPGSGRITIDGIDLRSFSQRAWRARVGLVLQDIHLFPGTLADNLRVFSDQIPLTQLERSIQAIGAEEMLRRFPGGLSAEIAEGGFNLSMGERQLVCFARSLVRDPDLLVLDEATSSVDPATERRIQASMERLMEGRTALIVAHRLSTVTSADRILVLQHGRLIQEGPHSDLLAEDGLYRALYDLQFAAGEVV